jgi:hypothetical protein
MERRDEGRSGFINARKEAPIRGSSGDEKKD